VMRSAFGEAGSGGAKPPLPATAAGTMASASSASAPVTKGFDRTGAVIL
jgi:hypothetical protein